VTPRGVPTVPGYDILGVLGHGGMGVVYRARHKALKREVALKMILKGEHASPSAVARFFTEAQAVARLNHPNIVQIYQIDEHEGLPSFALEYCAGGSLDRVLKKQPIPPGKPRNRPGHWRGPCRRRTTPG
jgi:eukaryotic-like serine/threonine-protein kinase